METIITIQKNSLSKLSRAFMFIALISLSFKANAQCTAGFTYTIDSLNNGQVYFTNTTTGTGPFNFYWTFGDGGSSYMVYPNYTYSSTGTYTVCLTVRDSVNMLDTTMGCHNTYCTTISVIDTTILCPTLNAFFTASDSSGYTHFQILSDSAGLNHFWDFGDGTTSTAAGSVTHLYTSPLTHVVCLTVTTLDNHCGTGYCLTLSSCHASYTYTPDAVGNGCTFNAIGSGSADTFNWVFGDGTTGTGPNPHHVYTADGNYAVSLTASSSFDATCSASYVDLVYMTGICDASFNIIQDSTNIFNYWIHYNSAFSTSSMTYLWDFGDGTTSTLQYPSHTYAASSPVTICLTISNSACTDTYCAPINPGHAAGTFTINILNPSGVSENANTNIISSLENYPNPFSDNTTITYSINQNSRIELSVLDLLGNKVAVIESGNKSNGNYIVNFDASAISGGIYLLQLQLDNKIITKKLVIAK